MLIKLYSLKTIILCIPALLLYEGAIILMAIIKGLLPTYIKAIISGVVVIPNIIRKRKGVKAIRRISDSELLTAAPLSLVPGGVSGVFQKKFLSLLNGFLIWYWKKVKVVL